MAGRKATLLNLVLIQMNRKNASELKKLDKWEKRYLADKLEQLEKPTQEDWNCIMQCLRGDRTKSCREARTEVLETLKG